MDDYERALDGLGYNSNDSAESDDNNKVDSEIDAANIGEDYIPSEDEHSGYFCYSGVNPDKT